MQFTIPRLAGGTLVVLLGVTLVLPGIASSSSAATPRSTVAVMRSRVVSGGRAVVIAGSGLPPGRTGEVAECSSAAPQPTVVTQPFPMPVSCTRPRRVRVGGDGALSSVRFRVVDGVVGPPSSGIDSWGTQRHRRPEVSVSAVSPAGFGRGLLLLPAQVGGRRRG